MPSLYSGAVDAADDILKKIYRVDVRKALDPLDHGDFEKICKHLADSFWKESFPLESSAYKKAIESLDVDWSGISADARHKVLDKAKSYLVPDKVIPPKLDQTIEMNAKDIYVKSKSKTILKYDLKIPSSFNQRDDKAIDFIVKSQGHYIRNAAGDRAEGWAGVARGLVQEGLENGHGSAQIAEKLASVIGVDPSMKKSEGYWNMIAMVFANRARTTSQLLSYHEAGIQVYSWESVMDEATSVQCRFMHGRKFPVHLAVASIQAVEDAGDPESIEEITPFVQFGKDGGDKAIYYGGRGKSPRTTIAYVEHNAVGQKDNPGKFSGHMGTGDLAAAGITCPPIHGRCRSTIIPDFAADGSITPASALGFGGPGAAAPKNPAFVPTPDKPAVPSSKEVQAKALQGLGELPAGGWGDGNVKAPFPVDMIPPWGDLFSNDQVKDLIATYGKDTKKPKLAAINIWDEECNPTTVASLIKSPKKLNAATENVRIIKFKGEHYLYGDTGPEGIEALTAHKLMGKTQVSMNVTDIDAIPTHLLPKKPLAVPLPTPPVVELKPEIVGPPHGHTPPGFATPPKPAASAALTSDIVLGQKVGDAKGSNEGGFYLGTDGVKRYVKFYTDPAQAAGEHLANNVYRDLHGSGAAANSAVFMHEGKICYASEIVEGVKTLGSVGLDSARAKQAMKGFIADVLTGNWDAAGATFDNMVITPSGSIMRVDNGGCFLMRAKNGRKPENALNAISEWDVFFSSKNPQYSQLAQTAGYGSPADFKKEVIEQIRDAMKLRDQAGGWEKYVDERAPLLKGKDREQVIAMLESRSKLLEAKAVELQNAKDPPPKGAPITAPRGRSVTPPPIDTKTMSIRRFQDLPLRTIPTSLDTPPDGSSVYEYKARAHAAIEKASTDSKNSIRRFTGSTYGEIREQAMLGGVGGSSEMQKHVENIEAAFGKVEPIPGQVFRGIDHGRITKEQFDAFMNQDELGLLGMASSSRTADVAVRFMGGTSGSDHKVFFVIHQKTSIPIETISGVPDENELLSSMRARYRVLARHRAEQNKEHCLIIEMEEIEGLVPTPSEPGVALPAKKPRRSTKKQDGWLRSRQETAMSKAKMHRDPLPADWPRSGMLDGKIVDLEWASDNLNSFQLASIVVDVPGVGPMQPWKGSDIAMIDGEVKI